MLEKFLTDAIVNFFYELNKKRVKYVVLRNYEDLPLSLDSKDLDLLIAKEDLKKAELILFKIMKSYGAKWYQRKYEKGLFSFLFVFDKNGKFFSLHIDFFLNFAYKIWLFLENKEVLSNRKKYKFFFVPLKEHEILIAFFKPYVLGGEIKSKYLKKYSPLVRKELKEEFKKLIKRYTFSNISEKITECFTLMDESCLKKLRNRFLFEAGLKSLLNSPIDSIAIFLFQYLIEMKKIFTNWFLPVFICENCNAERLVEELTQLQIQVMLIEKKLTLKEWVDSRRSFFLVIFLDNFPKCIHRIPCVRTFKVDDSCSLAFIFDRFLRRV